MQIISLIRSPYTEDMPCEFTVGDEDVKSIVFYQEGAYSQVKGQQVVFKAFKGSCYVVSYEGSSVKRIIPQREVMDIAIETREEVVIELPDAPTGASL